VLVGLDVSVEYPDLIVPFYSPFIAVDTEAFKVKY